MSGYSTPPGGFGALPGVPPPIAERKRKDRKVLLWALLITAVILLLLLWRCGTAFYKGAVASDAAAGEFHAKLNAERYQEIYSQADGQFKTSGKEEEYTQFFRGIHDKLGNAGTSTRGNINLNASPGGRYVIVTYQTKFAHGEAVETFTWRWQGERLLLVGYNIQSNELFSK
jgi:hypothetical protein